MWKRHRLEQVPKDNPELNILRKQLAGYLRTVKYNKKKDALPPETDVFEPITEKCRKFDKPYTLVEDVKQLETVKTKLIGIKVLALFTHGRRNTDKHFLLTLTNGSEVFLIDLTKLPNEVMFDE